MREETKKQIHEKRTTKNIKERREQEGRAQERIAQSEENRDKKKNKKRAKVIQQR